MRSIPTEFPRSMRDVALLTMAIAVACQGCAPRVENDAILLSSFDQEIVIPLLGAFERKNESVDVTTRFDIEVGLNDEIESRDQTPSRESRFDVYWSNEILDMLRLKKAGLLRSHNWQRPSDWPEQFMSSDGTWVGVGARARVLLINTERLPKEADQPKRVDDLAHPQWKDRCGLVNPLIGTSLTHLAVLDFSASRQADKGSPLHDWLERVRDNAVILESNDSLVQAVAMGDLDWCLVDSDAAMGEVDKGSKVTVVYPDQGEGEPGCLLIPGSVGVLKDAPHPFAAIQLAEFLASEDTDRRLTLGNAAQYSLWPSQPKSIVSTTLSVKFMQVDFEKVANIADETMKLIQSIFK